MREQKISSHDRTQIVDNQDTVWGDDEIVWHIKKCLSHCGKDTVWLDPLLAMGWAHSSECEALQAWYKLQINLHVLSPVFSPMAIGLRSFGG